VFFSGRRRHTRWPRDWSSDVCSSDLPMITVADMATALRDAGIAERQVLLVYSDVAYLGPITGVTGRAEYLAAIWDCLREAAGDHTTIVMSTASTYLCASGADFVLETTPCDTGLLSEYMRTLPGKQRS